MPSLVSAIVAAALLAAPTSSLAADRLSDPQLTELVQSIDKGFDRWKDDLERRNVDEAVIKSAAGTIDVKKFLKDLEDSLDLVKDRLKSTYAAGPEVTALLRRASDVERRYATQGSSEAWKPLSGQFAALAAAYSVSWPTDANANAERRMDGELAAEAARLAEASDRLRNNAVRTAADAKRPKPERDAAERDMKALKDAAKQLESNLKSHRAVPSDVTLVLDMTAKAVAFAQGVGPMKPDGVSALSTVQSTTKVIAQAFGRP
jgi:hypothetical protein